MMPFTLRTYRCAAQQLRACATPRRFSFFAADFHFVLIDLKHYGEDLRAAIRHYWMIRHLPAHAATMTIFTRYAIMRCRAASARRMRACRAARDIITHTPCLRATYHDIYA